jgi:hypothetical protein
MTFAVKPPQHRSDVPEAATSETPREEEPELEEAVS